MHLDIESLRTLLAVLDHGGMTRAAEHLDMSQSAVSWKIKRLEARVGRPLLIRDGHTLRPSRDGRALIDDARELVQLHDRAVGRLLTSELTGNVTLGAIADLGTPRIAAILGRFKRTHPNLTLKFIGEDSSKLTSLIDAGHIDVAVVQVDDQRLRADDVILWTDDLRWATCCETPFDTGTVPLVTFGENCFYRTLSEPILVANNIDYTIEFSVPSTAGVYSAIEAGLGVGVIGERELCGDIVEWGRGAALPPLPPVHQIARTVPGENTEVAAALRDAIVAELSEPGPRPVAQPKHH